MKILIVSKFFYTRGGAELVAIGTRQILAEAGHEVRVFAMDYPENIPMPEAVDFPEQIEFFGTGMGGKFKALRRMMGVGDVVAKMRKILDEFKPDVVHLHNIHSYLSPVVGELAHKAGARVVWTLHDFKLVCPGYLGRYPDGQVCTELMQGRCSLLSRRCMKGSLPASLMAALEARRWSKKHLNAMTDVFVAPSVFMARVMKAGGFPESKIHVLPNFVDPDKMALLEHSGSAEAATPYFAYIGRLSAEKGIATVVEAAKRAGAALRIAGDGPIRESLEKQAEGHDITFLGHLDAARVTALLKGAAATLLASEWYENNPLSVIESLCAGTPVIGADIGGIPELIKPGVNGEHFPSGDVEALTRIMTDFEQSRYDRQAIARTARDRFSKEAHLSQLLHIYTSRS